MMLINMSTRMKSDGRKDAEALAIYEAAEMLSKILNDRANTTKEYSPPLDLGIEREVLILNEHGIETYESCEGGEGHACLEPTILFHGERSEGFKALAIAIAYGLPVDALRREWIMQDHELIGPRWVMTFYHTKAE